MGCGQRYLGKSSKNPIDSLLAPFRDVFERADAINKEMTKAFHVDGVVSLPTLDDNLWCPLADVDDVFSELSKLSSSKSTGSDGIPNKFYKIAAPFIAQPLWNIINTSILERKIPEVFKQCVISPIPKVSSPNIDQLRPIALLNVPSKLLERLVFRSIKKLTVSCFPTSQFAYKPKSSTSSALITLHDKVTRLLDRPDVSSCVLLSYDFSKAFDSISHGILLKKLLAIRFPIGFVKWLEH